MSEAEKPPKEWIPKYWQWIYSFQQGNSPLETGAISCQSHGEDNFLCFPCTGGGEDCSRLVTITGDYAKKDILIPVFAAAYNAAELKQSIPKDQLLEMAKEDVRDPISLELTVDNVPLAAHYVESFPFQVKAPINHGSSLGDESHYTTLSAGYWYRLRPLLPGIHRIKFGGTGRNLFHTKVQYLIKIE